MPICSESSHMVVSRFSFLPPLMLWHILVPPYHTFFFLSKRARNMRIVFFCCSNWFSVWFCLWQDILIMLFICLWCRWKLDDNLRIWWGESKGKFSVWFCIWQGNLIMLFLSVYGVAENLVTFGIFDGGKQREEQVMNAWVACLCGTVVTRTQIWSRLIIVWDSELCPPTLMGFFGAT